ncbi:hypothetical protein DPV78_003400 [Talaromyces pinophilus]|nr:hypothetical protein DPV78_003400 [Talaromyces pinophilus]
MDHDGQFFTEIIKEIEKRWQSPCPQCGLRLTGLCFQQGHFDWCLSHQSTAVAGADACTHSGAKPSACSIAMWVDPVHISQESV